MHSFEDLRSIPDLLTHSSGKTFHDLRYNLPCAWTESRHDPQELKAGEIDNAGDQSSQLKYCLCGVETLRKL